MRKHGMDWGPEGHTSKKPKPTEPKALTDTVTEPRRRFGGWPTYSLVYGGTRRSADRFYQGSRDDE